MIDRTNKPDVSFSKEHLANPLHKIETFLIQWKWHPMGPLGNPRDVPRRIPVGHHGNLRRKSHVGSRGIPSGPMLSPMGSMGSHGVPPDWDGHPTGLHGTFHGIPPVYAIVCPVDYMAKATDCVHLERTNKFSTSADGLAGGEPQALSPNWCTVRLR